MIYDILAAKVLTKVNATFLAAALFIQTANFSDIFALIESF